MKTIYQILSFAVLLGLVTACQEDPLELSTYGQIRGTLLDEVTFEPIAEAVVTTVPATNVFISDENGQFFIDSLEVENYTVRIKADGYREGLQNVAIEADRTKEVTILLIEAQEEEEEVLAPENPQPEDGATGLDVAVDLTWSAGTNTSDTLRYDVLLYSEHDPDGRVLAESITDTTLRVEDLDYETTYFWQVKVEAGEVPDVFGPVWKFTTSNFPDYRYHYVRRDATTGEMGVYAGQTGDQSGEETNEILLTTGMGDCWRPRVSPDRQKIAFLSFSGTQLHLFVMNRDGSEVQQVTDEIPVMSYDIERLDYAWSPNSAQLLYMNFNRAYKINVDGTGLSLFAEAPEGRAFSGLDWTAHPNHVVARVRGNQHYQDELFLINPAGELDTLLADQPGALGNPMFSVDGTQVLYTYDISGSQNPNGRLIDVDLFIRNIQTGGTQNLSALKEPGTNDVQARFSSTGGDVIFTSVPNDGVGSPSIMSVDLDGTDRISLFIDAFMVDNR